MTGPAELVCCLVLDGFQVPRPDGSTAYAGDRVLMSATSARRWQARGAVDILDETSPDHDPR